VSRLFQQFDRLEARIRFLVGSFIFFAIVFRPEAGNSVGIASRLRAGRSGIGGSILDRGKRLILLHEVQTCSRYHPTSYPMVAVVCFFGVKWQGREAGHSM
jgi:hypothetical protein